MLVTILVFVGILLVLVLAHEAGHFWAARKVGVKVEEFAFGFPPKIFSYIRKGTTYSFNWLPLGGFVRLKGELDGDRTDPESFVSKKFWQKTVVVVAGVFMNVLVAYVLITGGLIIGFPTALDEQDIALAKNIKVQIIQVLPDSPAAQADLKPGDTIKQVNGVSYLKLSEVQKAISDAGDNNVSLLIARGSENINVEAHPKILTEGEGRYVIGVGLAQTGTVSYPWYEAVWRGALGTWRLGVEIVKGFGSLFSNLIIHRQVPQDVAGPVGIAVLTGQVVDMGWLYLLQFAALLSLNLAIINILPFPALDGGRWLFIIIEKLRGKPNDERIEAYIHNAGFAILMVLVVLLTYRDVARLTGNFAGLISKFWGG